MTAALPLAQDVTAVLLAAGFARRFGSDKRRLPCPPHDSLMAAALAPLQAVCQRVLVVLAPGDAWGVLQCRRLGVEVVWSFWPEQGLAASLAAVLPSLAEPGPAPQAMLVALADMGRVQEATLRQLIEAWRQAPQQLALPQYQGQAGNPRLIASALWPRLAGASGDDGVRRALPWAQATIVPMADPGVLQDVDTAEDARLLLQALAQG